MINSYELLALKKSFGSPTELWKSAFKEFNDNQTLKGERTLSMNCRSCWFKVYKYHESKLNP